MTFNFNGIKALLFAVFLLSIFIFSCSKPAKEIDDKAPLAFTASVSNVSAKSASLSWTESKDPENQRILYSVELNSSSVAFNITGTSLVLKDLIKNSTYNGKVIAQDPAGNKTEATFTFTTSDAPSPSDFVLTVDSASSKKVWVSWTRSILPDNSEVSYDVFVNNVMKVSGLTEQKFEITSLIPSTTYQIKIVAKSQEGKSLEKSLDATTKQNTAPSSFTIQNLEYSFDYILISGSAVLDPEQDSLQYFVVKNGVETLIPALANNTAPFSRRISLTPGTDYSIAIRVKDQYNASTTSNIISLTTYNYPADPTISVKETYDKVLVEWLSYTQAPFDSPQSVYYINGVARPLNTSQLTMTPASDGKMNVQLKLDPSEFQRDVNQPISIKLKYGGNSGNEYYFYSNTVNYYINSYTPTSAQISSAIVRGPSGSFQFNIYYTNALISEYNNYNILRIQFEDFVVSNFGTVIGASPNLGYHVGVFNADIYNYLKTKNRGFVLIQDQSGVHRHNFNYTSPE